MNFLRADSKLLQPERQCRSEGFRFIAGVDEAGRGPLAGPVVAAAVIFLAGARIPKVFDSKQLTPEKRSELEVALQNSPQIKIGIGECSAEEIDTWNILRATHLAMRRALENLDCEFDFILVDGLPVRDLPAPSRALVGGDALSASIAAASIIAKEHRDRIMRKFDLLYPEYGFARNKGYGTTEHIEALQVHGASPIHRRTFAPLKEWLSDHRQDELF